MMTRYTPGPWAVVDGYYPSFKEITGLSFKISVVMIATDLTQEDYYRRSADLRLIAAAPDLVEALKMAVSALERSDYIMMDGDSVDVVDNAREAINKATGE